jgi:hypothetical protein
MPWRDVPDCYGSWAAAYALFRRWQRDGTWARILTALQAFADAAGRIVWDESVDSTTARAHQHAAGARKRGDLQVEPLGGLREEPADHALGRSRGWVDHETASGLRTGSETVVDRADCRTAWRRSAVRGGPGRYPGTAGRRGPAAGTPGSCPRGQGLHIAGEPPLPTPAGDQSNHPEQRPTRTPTGASSDRRAAGHRRSTLRSTSGATLWRAASTGAQTQPRRRHPIRQTRRALRSHRAHRRHQRMAVTDFDTGPRHMSRHRTRPGRPHVVPSRLRATFPSFAQYRSHRLRRQQEWPLETSRLRLWRALRRRNECRDNASP